MNVNFYDNSKMIDSQMGDQNIIFNSAENDPWKEIENIFDKKAEEFKNDPSLNEFFQNSRNYASNKDKIGLEKFYTQKGKQFLENVFCNLASSGILALLKIIGISL